MGLGTSAIKLNLELWQRGMFKGIKSVLDLGAQDLHVTAADFEGLIRTAGVHNYKREKFTHLGNWPRQPRCSSKPFYNSPSEALPWSQDLFGPAPGNQVDQLSPKLWSLTRQTNWHL